MLARIVTMAAGAAHERAQGRRKNKQYQSAVTQLDHAASLLS
jgi:hypothetical protein